MKFFKLPVLLLLGFFLVALPVLAQDFPEPTGYVNDFAQLLSPDYRDSLEQNLTEFEEKTTAEIAVVTINSLEGNSLEDYAVRLFEEWKIGKKEKDNGLLILVSKEERKIRIEVGYGLEPVITDGRAGKIIREEMKPAFKEDNYDQGIKLAVEKIQGYITSGEVPSSQEEIQVKALAILPLIIISFIILIYASSFLGRSKRFWPGGVIGGIMGGVLGLIIGTILSFALLTFSLGIFGLLLDYVLSKNYKKLKKKKKPTGFTKSWGGFFSGGGGSSGGGFGGFSGGSGGGGGASGGW